MREGVVMGVKHASTEYADKQRRTMTCVHPIPFFERLSVYLDATQASIKLYCILLYCILSYCIVF